MLVAAFYTLYNMRSTLITGISKAFGDVGAAASGRETIRTEKDLDLKKVIIGIIIMLVPLFFLYLQLSDSLKGSIVLTVVMVILGFFFAAVAGYLVGVVGSSNNPISGLTLPSLLVTMAQLSTMSMH